MYFKEVYEQEIQRREKDIQNAVEKFEMLDLHGDIDPLQAKYEVAFCAMKQAMSYNISEVRDIAEVVVNCLEKIGDEIPINSNFINSLYNFDSIYLPLYELLDLASTRKYKGEEKSNEYRLGIIDAIITLRRFQRFSGFGDFEWEPSFNSALNISVPERSHNH